MSAVCQATSHKVYPSATFEFLFDEPSCSIQVLKQGSSGIPLWSSDNTVIQFGEGDVDTITIMTAGNVANFPQVTSTLSTTAIDCQMLEDYQLSIIYVGGMTQTVNSTNVPFIMAFDFKDNEAVSVQVDVDSAPGQWLSVNYASPSDEEIYGMGLQPTVWNFKGKSVPLIVDEGGVGRGL